MCIKSSGQKTGTPKTVILLLLSLSFSFTTQAGIIASATRVIFQPGKEEQSLMLVNTNPYSILVQTWVDKGENNPAPEKVKAPFITLPPLFQLKAGEMRGLRIIYNHQPLAQNKESVYWLNLYEVPPIRAIKVPYQGQIAMGMNTQMKIFFRPKGLSGTMRQAVDKLSFSLQWQGKHPLLVCHNHSAFHISFATLVVRVNSKNNKVEKYPVEAQSDMMTPPYSQHAYPLTTLPATQAVMDVEAVLIDDQGYQKIKSYPVNGR